MDEGLQKIITDAQLGAMQTMLENLPEAERLSAEFQKAKRELDNSLILVESSKQVIQILMDRHNMIMQIATEKAEALKAAHAACERFMEHTHL